MTDGDWIVVGEEGAPSYGEGWSGDMRFRKVSHEEGDYFEIRGSATPSSPVFVLPEEARPGFKFTALVVIEDETGGVCFRESAAPAPPPALPDPYVEPWTFGQGSFGHRCRVCLADDYAGPLVHKPGCPGAA